MTYAPVAPRHHHANTANLPPWQHQLPQQLPPPAPGRRRRPVVLVVLLIAMVLAAGTFGALYLTSIGDQHAAAETLRHKETELGNANDKLAKETEARKAAEGRAEQAEQDLSAAQTGTENLEACRTASQDLLSLLRTGNPADPALQQQLAAALNTVSIACV